MGQSEDQLQCGPIVCLEAYAIAIGSYMQATPGVQNRKFVSRLLLKWSSDIFDESLVPRYCEEKLGQNKSIATRMRRLLGEMKHCNEVGKEK